MITDTKKVTEKKIKNIFKKNVSEYVLRDFEKALRAMESVIMLPNTRGRAVSTPGQLIKHLSKSTYKKRDLKKVNPTELFGFFYACHDIV